jgi:hypothetical protein
MNNRLSVLVLALLIVVAGLAWGSVMQGASHGNKDLPVLAAQGSRPVPPLPPAVSR